MPYVLGIYLLVLACSLGLRLLNIRHLRRHGGVVPPELAATIDARNLPRTAAYTVEKERLDTLQTLVGTGLAGVFLFAGLLGAYDAWIARRGLPFVWSGWLFFIGIFAAESILRIPFSLAEHFHIERRYGFNRMGLGLWMSDWLKGFGLAVGIGSILVGGGLALVVWSPAWWWLWCWGFFLAFSLFLLYISPYVIEPLFFKLEPVRVAGLEESIQELLGRAGLRASRVFQMDASRRSAHSNAYFTGLGRVKRIVLFDTLVSQLDPAEILAVLAHEAGHWKKHHVLQRIVMTEGIALGGLYAAFRLVHIPGLPGLFGLQEASYPARALMLMTLFTLAAFPLTPLTSWLSRRHEWAADRFASDLTRRPQELASALAKLARDNLSNLYPHPLYARFHYSHPPVTERIRLLQGSMNTHPSAPAPSGSPGGGRPTGRVPESRDFIPQAAAIPVRGEEVCLVTSSTGKRWGIPKGLIEPEETATDCALKEAWEEAGVSGTLDPESVGSYFYTKWGGTYRVTVYILRVTEVHDEWPEKALRERIWVSFAEAVQRVSDPGLKRVLRDVLTARRE